jgi:hypothetical protein
MGTTNWLGSILLARCQQKRCVQNGCTALLQMISANKNIIVNNTLAYFMGEVVILLRN